MTTLQNKIIFFLIFSSLVVFVCIIFPLPVFFSNDEFGSLPLIAKNKLIISSLPRPLANFSVYLDFLIWYFNPFGYHLTNVIIHLANSLLIYLFYDELQKKTKKDIGGRKIKSVVAAILFLFYSNNTECIFWISARGSSLACFFVLISLLLFLKRETGKYYILLSLLSFIAGLLAYETSWIIIAAIPILCIYEEKKKKDIIRKNLPVLSSYLIVFIIYIIWRYMISGDIAIDYVSRNYVTGNFWLIAKNLAQLFTRTLLPPMHSTKSFVISAVCLLLLLNLIIIIKKISIKNLLVDKRFYLFILFFISLLPASSIGISIHTSEGERFIYLANAFVVLLILEMLNAVTNKRRNFSAVALIAIVIIQLIFLLKKTEDYNKSSKMMLETISQLKSRSPKNFTTIYTINQPDNLNGAVMFRGGFEHAIRWLIPDLRFEKLIITSSEQLTNSYKVNFRNAPYETVKNKLASYAIPFEKGKDCILWFNPSTIYFIQ
jgi:protein O-mannosyl-transferase